MPGGYGCPSASAQLALGEFPVHQLPECFQIACTIILVVGVVRVLPDIAAEQRRAVAGQRRTRIAGGLQAELPAGVLHQPHPAGAEQAKRGSIELFAQTLAVAELALDQFAQAALRLATAARAQALPVEAVVPRLGGGIEQR